MLRFDSFRLLDKKNPSPGAFFNTHFNFLMAIVGLKIRASLVTTIYRKTLSVSSTVLNSAFSTGEIVNFMSTDTDRVVNACPSFHALWSIPFQASIHTFSIFFFLVYGPNKSLTDRRHTLSAVQSSRAGVPGRCRFHGRPHTDQ